MRRAWAMVLVSVLLAVVTGVVSWWALSPEPSPRGSGAGRAAPTARTSWLAPLIASGRGRASGASGSGGPAKARELDPEARVARRTEARKREHEVTKPEAKLEEQERAELRQLTREEVRQDLVLRVSDHAELAGWTPEEQELVQDILARSTDRITQALVRVDRGEISWDEVRRDVRQYRLDQAAEVEGVLGVERFKDLVVDLDLPRFMGEEPVRGRL